MIVIISDLHLTDGTSGQTIKTGAFQIFAERMREHARDASSRKNGVYKPVECIDIILLGDILDVLRSTTWNDLPPDIRPWGEISDKFVNQVRYVTERILEANRDSLAVLKALSRGVEIPATENPSGGVVTVPVKLRYLVGNHDWFYHLPRTDLDPVRNAIIDAMGLANPRNTPFPHDPEEWEDLVASYKAHRVFARHGDIYDPDNYENGTRDGSSIGDAVVIELINRFTVLVNENHRLPNSCKKALREIDNVRPLSMIPAWVYGMTHKTCKDHGEVITEIWRQTAAAFLRVPFVKRHSMWLHPFRDVFSLAFGLLLSRVVPLSIISAVAIRKSAGRDHPSYGDTRSETWLTKGLAQFVVYGHTHREVIVPLRGTLGRKTVDQVYFNSGTWRPIHELAQFQRSRQQFVGYQVMTYIAFFQDDEFAGRGFDCWSGALDQE